MKDSVTKILTIICLLMCIACNQQTPQNKSDNTIYTDTIVYNVSLKPQYEHEVDWLKAFNRDAMIDSIFKSVYYHGAEVRDFAEENIMTLDEIKSLEIEDPRFSRDKASLLQFTEAWAYDPQQNTFKKKVLSIHVAYEIIDDNGKLIGHRGGFIIKMK